MIKFIMRKFKRKLSSQDVLMNKIIQIIKYGRKLVVEQTAEGFRKDSFQSDNACLEIQTIDSTPMLFINIKINGIDYNPTKEKHKERILLALNKRINSSVEADAKRILRAIQ